jgi:hypothetical protein
MANQIINPQLRTGDEIVHSFWTEEFGVITRIGPVTDLYDVDNRPYCIYRDSTTNKFCGIYLDAEVAITVLKESQG